MHRHGRRPTASSGSRLVHTENFLPVESNHDWQHATIAGIAEAIGERFSSDPISITWSWHASSTGPTPTPYDQLIVWTDTVMTPENRFAFEVNVANDISGIGLRQFDFSSDFGSTGRRLRSVVQWMPCRSFPDDPMTKFLGENNTLSILGHEVGHRWLAFLQFTDHNRQRSDALLGRDQAHWSFFFNSDGSVDGRQRHSGSGRRCLQDRRRRGEVTACSISTLMGLVRDTDVPPFFYVENPTNVQPTAECRARRRELE